MGLHDAGKACEEPLGVHAAVIGLAPISGGCIRLLGQDVATAAASQRKVLARRCQYVFQNSLAAMNPRLRIRDIIAEPLRVHGLIEDGNVDDRLVMLLEEVGLERAHLRRFPHELPGGQRQRVCIARALAHYQIFDYVLNGTLTS